MFRTRVLTLLWLSVQLVNSLSWDIVVGQDKRLEFYYNGTLTHTEEIPSANVIQSVTYDPVHYRVLIADCNNSNMSISSFDLSTRKIQPLFLSESKGNCFFLRIVYDPVTQLIFWNYYLGIYSLSLNCASSNKAVEGNLVVKLDCYDIAVDSCGGYIYCIRNNIVERARFDGSGREVVINNYVYERRSLAIDQQTQKIYWPETNLVKGNYQLSIESADFNGKNRTTLHIVVSDDRDTYGYALAVSKDFIYVKNYDQVGIWKLPKFPSQHEKGKLFLKSSPDYSVRHNIAANYAMKEQIQGIKSCDALQFLIRNNSTPESTILICQNYCFQGDCSVSAEGQPTCRCNAGYSGLRCEVNTCYNYCLNNGVCSLNEQDEAVCECTADYEGVRCDVATTYTGVHADNTTPQVLRDLYSAVKHTLHFYSDKIDKNEAQIEKNEKSIMDIKNHCTGLEYHDETTPKTQTFN